ncbi:MAG: hypothetical protein LCH53_04230 [Bacteroidetes bacterium]|nr:hypothetical protein [Bacteroidota bacterium]
MPNRFGTSDVDHYPWLTHVVISVQPQGGAVQHNVLMASGLQVWLRPFFKGSESIVTLVSGERVEPPRHRRFHVDSMLRWEHQEQYESASFKALLVALLERASSTSVWFYPRANNALTGPHAEYDPIEVVPELSKEHVAMAYEARVFQRPAELSLPGRFPLLASAIPAWVKR